MWAIKLVHGLQVIGRVLGWVITILTILLGVAAIAVVVAETVKNPPSGPSIAVFVALGLVAAAVVFVGRKYDQQLAAQQAREQHIEP